MTISRRLPLTDSAKNPFAVESPERLTAREIVDLFIEDFTETGKIKERKHTVIWGARGSGKSMMLRYLEPQCQCLKYGTMDQFLASDMRYLAVYVPCKEGHINKTETNLLEENASLVVSEHLINLHIAGQLVDCLSNQFPPDFFPGQELIAFVRKASELFDRTSIVSSIAEASELRNLSDDPLGWLSAIFSAEHRRIANFLRMFPLHARDVAYTASTSGYHDFLLPLMRLVRNSFSRLHGTCIYLLIDDADKLHKRQQTIVNSWIANRDQGLLCIKLSAQRERFCTFHTRDGGLIEQPHDYSEVDVDELYTQSKSDYCEKVRLIADKRLELSQVPTKSIEKFLPPDPTQESLLNELKKKTASEWEQRGKPGRRADYVTRYSTARLFQHLRSTKQRRNYAGFQNIVDISSGVVRDFLEPCYNMFDKCLSQRQDLACLHEISPTIQGKEVFDYSEKFLLLRLDDIRRDLPPEKWTHVERLRVLIESLGRLFYKRLHDPDAREARLFSFTIRGQNVPGDLRDVLRLGVIYRYFQQRSYSTKEGGGREDWFILNRRLCPVFNLDPTGFEGRISISPSLLMLALSDSDRFVRLRLIKSSDSKQLDLFDLQNGAQDEPA